MTVACAVEGDLEASRAVSGRRFTAEQRAAIDDRRGSALLSAAAGSGKTAVMVERFAEAVLADGVPVASVLALTFTEKAAGELRERLRRRFEELGRDELAHETDAAWVGTIHGFCARVLRSEALAAGLDPRFTVLDEAAAARLASEAFSAALEAFAAAGGEDALSLAGAYRHDLEDMTRSTHEALRSAGSTHPRLPLPPSAPAPDPRPLRAAIPSARGCLAAGGGGAVVAAALDALDALDAALGGAAGGVPLPTTLDCGRLKGRAAALQGEECRTYQDLLEAYRQACADFHGRRALAGLDDLLARYADAYAQAKARRGGVDFADLELRVRDLLAAQPAMRERWAGRFALIMVDEFQDTNRVQLDVLEAVERDNLFAVGDELQSIYGFRHADVEIFRERRAALGEGRVRRLTANFRSRESILDVLNGAFAPVFGAGYVPLRAGRAAGAAPPAGEAQPGGVELRLVDARDWDAREEELGLASLASQPWRRAEARLLAARLRAERDAGRPAGDMVVLVRATSSLRLFEQALEEAGVPTYVLGGRGYWSGEQVRDGLAYLSALANPLDEESLLTALASPFAGAGADSLILLARAGQQSGRGLWAALEAAGRSGTLAGVGGAERARVLAFADWMRAERGLAERLPAEVLLDRGVAALGYDLAVLARAGGDRRLANLRKLMRMAREYERAEGHDLRGFVDWAAEQDLREAREGEAPLETENLDAVRLMTIHRAKGLEFPLVALADLGRAGNASRPALLVGRDGRAGLRLAVPGAPSRTAALHYEDLCEERAQAEDEEERRLIYVAATRAQETLILSGGIDFGRLPEARAGGPPLNWLLRALVGDPAAPLAAARQAGGPGAVLATPGGGRLRVCATAAADVLPAPAGREATPAEGGEDVPEAAAAGAPSAPSASAREAWPPASGPPLPPTLERLSYSSLAAHRRCGYRFYLQRFLRLPDEPEAAGAQGEQLPLLPAPPVLDPRLRGSIVHSLLEEIEVLGDVPATGRVREALARAGVGSPGDAEIADVARLVAAVGDSPLLERLHRALRVRREAPFGFSPGGRLPLLEGYVDVWAQEPDGGVLVIDYKTEPPGEDGGHALVEERYGLQRALYARAALTAGAARAEVAFLFLEAPDDPVVSIFRPADAAALDARLARAASGVLEGRYPVAAEPHRGLCGDCPGRRVLCSHPEALTLRERPTAHAGAGVPAEGRPDSA